MSAKRITRQRVDEAVADIVRITRESAQKDTETRLRYFASVLSEEILVKSSTTAVRETLLLMDFAWKVGRDSSRSASALPSVDSEGSSCAGVPG